MFRLANTLRRLRASIQEQFDSLLLNLLELEEMSPRLLHTDQQRGCWRDDVSPQSKSTRQLVTLPSRWHGRRGPWWQEESPRRKLTPIKRKRTKHWCRGKSDRTQKF